MNKKLLSITIATALTLPALSYAETTLYGTFNADFESASATGATDGVHNISARTRLDSNSSNFGIRSSEDLMYGLKAILQLESSVNVNGSNVSPGANAGATGSLLSTRNTNIGLTGKTLGTIFYGNWDTPYKSATLMLGPWWDTGVGAFENVIGNPGFGVSSPLSDSGRTGSTDDASFNRRQGQSVQYWTPNFNGFSARVGYSSNAGKSPDSLAAGSVGISPSILSGALIYEKGPVALSAAYERHNDYFGLSVFSLNGNPFGAGVKVGAAGSTAGATSSRDDAEKIGAGYTFATGTTLQGILERLNYNNDDATAGDVTHYSRTAGWLGLEQKVGAATYLRATYGKAQGGDCTVNGKACSTSGLGASMYTFGADWKLSKMTDVYAIYSKIKNESASSHPFAFSPLSGAGAGADPQAIGLGMRKKF